MKRGMYIHGMLLAAAVSMGLPLRGLAASPVVDAGGGGTSGQVQLIGPGGETVHASAADDKVQTIDPGRFVLPQEARVLAAVEGTGGSACRVYVWEKLGEDWQLRIETDGYLGERGMSISRTEGDKTTPIGVFQMNTPFGQDDPLEGFPSNYIKVKESHVWEDDSNRLVDGSTEPGEHVGTHWYAGYYDYAVDMGFNRSGIAGNGSALFLHCTRSDKTSSSGCVAIPKEQMAEVMKLYGTYGDGACYIALAYRGTFEQIYDTYGANQGLSPQL